jgi:hypothetical protein
MVCDNNNPGFGAMVERMRRYRPGMNKQADNVVNILFDVVMPGLRVRERVDRDYLVDLVKESGVKVLPESKSDENLRVDVSWFLSAAKYMGILKSHRLRGEYVVQEGWEDKLAAAIKGFNAGKAL